MSKTTVKALYFAAGALFTLAVVAAGWHGLKPVDFGDPVDVIAAFPDPPSAPDQSPPEVETRPDDPLPGDGIHAAVRHDHLLAFALTLRESLMKDVTALQEELTKAQKHLATHHADVHNLKLWLAARDQEVEQLHREIGAVCYGIESR